MSRRDAPGQVDVPTLLARLVALTELEAELLTTMDATALQALCDERGAVLADLAGRPLPSSAAAQVERFAALRAANEATARERLADLRRQLARLDTSRGALGAYAPPSAAVEGVMEREG